jgi:hypothetical protein
MTKGPKTTRTVPLPSPIIQTDGLPCGNRKCVHTVTNEGIQCDLCHLWFHPRCGKLSKRLYEVYSRHNRLEWTCPICKELIRSLVPRSVSDCVFDSDSESLGEPSTVVELQTIISDTPSPKECDTQAPAQPISSKVVPVSPMGKGLSEVIQADYIDDHYQQSFRDNKDNTKMAKTRRKKTTG